MIHIQVNPQDLANLLWNAVAITKVKAGERCVEDILLYFHKGTLYSYGFAQHSAGRGEIHLDTVVEGEESVCITRDEAEELQKQLRSMSKARDAVVSVVIDEDADPGYNLIVSDGEEPICELFDSDPDGAHSEKWEAIDTWLGNADARMVDPVPCPLMFALPTIKRLTDIKPPAPMVDFVSTGAERPVAARVGPNFLAVLGQVDRDLYAQENGDDALFA